MPVKISQSYSPCTVKKLLETILHQYYYYYKLETGVSFIYTYFPAISGSAVRKSLSLTLMEDIFLLEYLMFVSSILKVAKKVSYHVMTLFQHCSSEKL